MECWGNEEKTQYSSTPARQAKSVDRARNLIHILDMNSIYWLYPRISCVLVYTLFQC
jgi:hypothetical protein